VDSLHHTKEFVEKLGIRYPVAYGLDAEEVSRVTGAYYEKERKFIHPTGFLVRPDKAIEVSCYSSGPIGRFVAQDVLRVIRFYKSRK
jgi:alkyl hydroperoxide reductase subunit AhpC